MTDQTQQPTQLSEKVTPTLLDRMYNNFVKITDWVVKGKESKYPLPKALAWLFDTTEQNTNEVAELKQLVTTLQNNLVQKEQRITALDGALQNVNTTLANFISRLEQGDISAMNSQAVTGVTPQAQNLVVPDPVVTSPAPGEVTDELVDLDEVVTDNQPPSVGMGAVPNTGEQSQNASLTPSVQVSPKQGSQVEPVRPVSPNEQAIQVSAAAVGAGNIDPASYQALDAEIGALLG